MNLCAGPGCAAVGGAPNAKGGPQADSGQYKPASWYSDREMVRCAYILRECRIRAWRR
jgi:hypothetical protein